MIQTIIDWVSGHIPPWVFFALIFHGAVLGTVAYLILLERKVASWAQDRIGPNRVGLDFGILPFKFLKRMNGLGQPLADGIKFIVKEDYRAAGTDKILFTVAPGIMIIVIIISIAVLPWGGIRQTTRDVVVPGNVTNVDEYLHNQVTAGTTLLDAKEIGNTNKWTITYQYPFQIASLNIGVLFILAVLSLAVYGVVIGGWASNNKYSFLGGLRATVNMISYEIPMGLAVLAIVVMYGTLDLNIIVDKQAHYWWGIIPAWNCFTQPLTFLMFLTCIHAEANRAPFDLAEAEQELVGGYHTEYSAMRFALFFLAEYAGMITTSGICVALFFGGWHVPWIDKLWTPLAGTAGNPSVTTYIAANIIRAMVFFGKTLAVVFVFMWSRWSLPRFRFDQLMMIAWRGLIPISLGLLMMTAGIVYYFHGESFDGVGETMAVALFVANVIAGILILVASTLIPAAPLTNRRLKVIGSRYNKTPLPANVN